MNTEFGITAWGRGWLRVAEPTTIQVPDSRLPRARALARRGHVRDLAVVPGQVRATVDDGRSYAVEIKVPCWTDEQRAIARHIVNEHHTAPSAIGELPDELDAALRSAGLPAAPRPPYTLTGDCTCTRPKPCLHMIATCFALIQAIDEHPFLALTLRGLDLPQHHESPLRIPLSQLRTTDFYEK